MKGKETEGSPELTTFSLIEDVPLTIEAVLDRRRISFRELLDLRPGSVIRLTRPTGENIDLYAGNALIGYGEVLVVESLLAIRVADLREPEEAEATGAALKREPAAI
jgi:flagellar motor switch protein FliN/FliY